MTKPVFNTSKTETEIVIPMQDTSTLRTLYGKLNEFTHFENHHLTRDDNNVSILDKFFGMKFMKKTIEFSYSTQLEKHICMRV
jgi:hypothetical protein